MDFLRKTIGDFLEHRCSMLAAALAYYTIFALPPLLYLLLNVLTLGLTSVYESGMAEEKAQAMLERQAAQMIGNQQATEEISAILESDRRTPGKWWRTIISFVGIIVAATGVVAGLQDALNRVWSVRPDPQRSGLGDFLAKRLLSFAMILGLGFLLLVSFVVSTLLALLGERIGAIVGMDTAIAQAINLGVQILVVFVIFASIFRFMPDAIVVWRDVCVGAVITTALFLIGRFVLQLYLSAGSPAEHLGSAAASLAVILIWVYYTAMIVLFGAEITQVYASRFGGGIAPEPNAVRVTETIDRTAPTRS